MAANRSAQRQRAGNGSSDGFDPVMLMAMVGLACMLVFLLWYKFHTQIAMAYGYWRMTTNAAGWVIGEYVANVPGVVRPFHDSVEYFRQTPFSEVPFSKIMETTLPVNIGLVLLVVLPLAIRSIRVSLKTNPLNHKNYGKPRDFTVFTFMKVQEKVYPHLKLYGALNMLKQPINTGRLRMADTAKQFVLAHKLVAREAKQDKVLVNRQRAATVFRAQLGDFWHGLDRLKVQEIVLFGVFAPKAAATDAKMSDGEYAKALDLSASLLNDLWHVFSPDDKGNVPSGKQLIERLGKSGVYSRCVESAKRYIDNRVVKDIVTRHAYTKTVLYELLDVARKTGVLASAEFRWLKLVDRALWFVMNTVGRAVAVSEASGVYGHYLYESKAGRAVEKPMVETALDALEGAFAKLVFTDEEWVGVISQRSVEDEAAKPAEGAQTSAGQ